MSSAFQYDNKAFERLVEAHLLPLFNRAKITNIFPGALKSDGLAAIRPGGRSLKVRPSIKTDKWLLLERASIFSAAEQSLAQIFCERMGALSLENADRVEDLRTPTMRRIVARATNQGLEHILVSVLDQYASWSEQTYEGRRIASGVYIQDLPKPAGVPGLAITDFFKEDFSRIVSNGTDSWVTIDSKGVVLGHETSASKVYPDGNYYYPYKYKGIACATRNTGVAAVLNRNGDILVFARGNIIFAKRRGVWLNFNHEEIVKSITTGGAMLLELRRDIYRSCLDAAFARFGACIAIASKRHIKTLNGDKAIESDDIIKISRSPKGQFLKLLINNTHFSNIQRHTRREMLSLDGATVLDSSGRVISCGAIVKINAGSTGGGRKAAAIGLSKYGVGIKVSSDGVIVGFKNGQEVLRVA